MGGFRPWLVAGLGLLLLPGCTGQVAAPAREQRLPPWAWQMPHCVAYQPDQLEAPQHRRSAQILDQPGVTEQVEEYETGWGARAVAEIRTVVRDCGRYEYGGQQDPSGFLAQNRVVETGFGGDESLLVETVHLVPPASQTWYAAVVRHGDQVTTVRTSERTAAQTRCLAVAEAATCA